MFTMTVGERCPIWQTKRYVFLGPMRQIYRFIIHAKKSLAVWISWKPIKPNYRLITLKITSDRSGLHQRKHLPLGFRRPSGRVIWVTHTELYNYLCALVTRTFLNFLISYFYLKFFIHTLYPYRRHLFTYHMET